MKTTTDKRVTRSATPPAVDVVAEVDGWITQEVAKQLRGSPHFGLRRLTCQHRAGALILRGYVPSFYQKQMAQEVARAVSGVTTIINQLDVASVNEWPHDSCGGSVPVPEDNHVGTKPKTGRTDCNR